MCIRDSTSAVGARVWLTAGGVRQMREVGAGGGYLSQDSPCLLYTSDAADERSSVDIGGRRIIQKK